jgi:hypothetical protein
MFIKLYLPLRRSHAAFPAHGLAFDAADLNAPLFSQRQVDAAIAKALKDERAISSAILSDAAPYKPIDANAVVLLARDAIKVNDEGSLTVQTEDGKSRYGRDGNPMTVSNFMAEFAKANPYLFAMSAGPSVRNSPGQESKALSGVEKIAQGLARRK